MLFIRLLIMVRQVRHSIQLCVYGLVLYYSQVLRQRMFILKEKIKTLLKREQFSARMFTFIVMGLVKH